MLQTVEGTYQNGRVELLETLPEVLRARVIVTFLDVESEPSPANGNEEKPKTFAEVAAHLIGSVDSGLGDLATNKKYMEGFGRENKSNR